MADDKKMDATGEETLGKGAVPPAAPEGGAPVAPADSFWKGADACLPSDGVKAKFAEERKQPPCHPGDLVSVSAAEDGGRTAGSGKNAPLAVAIALIALLIVALVSSCVAGFGRSTSGVSMADKVAVIELSGSIQYDGTACSPEGFKSLLAQAEQDPTVKAVVLRVNSGGGSAAAGEEMMEALQAFQKPVVVSTAGVNASAAYGISAQADYIYAGRASEVGSIGTIMQHMDYSELMDMLGIGVDVIASADSKDAGSGARPLTESEAEHYRQMVEEINEMLVSNIAEGRKVSQDKVREWATGMTWAGETAKKMGLIDGIGTYDDAVDKAAELGECKTGYETVDLYLQTSPWEGLGGLI